MPALQDAAFVASLAWILHRIWQIYQKPVDELVNLLGLDIPPVPEVSLAGITTDSVLLYWKPPESPHPSSVHSIHVNGIKVGEFGRGDTSITISGLKSRHFYSVRVVASNAANFSTLGPLMRLRTLPVKSMNENGVAVGNDEGTAAAKDQHEAAAVHTSSARFEPPSLQQMAKESSGGVVQARRVGSGRRSLLMTSDRSPSGTEVEQQDEQPAENDCLQNLTKKLDSLRQEQQELDKQILEEEEEGRKVTSELIKERDRLRQTLKEREEGNAELKRHGNILNKQQKTAQSRKAQKERLLNAKKAERQKLIDEASQWDQEIINMRQEVAEMNQEKAEVATENDRQISDIRRHIAEDQSVIRSLEEEIRSTGSQLKMLEKDREKLSDGGEEEQTLAAREKQEDQVWEAHAQGIQLHLSALWQTLQQANADNQRAKEMLAYWTSLRARDPSEFAPLSAFDYTSSLRSSRSHRNRQSNSRTSTVSSPQGAHAVAPGPFNMSSVSPPFSSASPFFNMGNGMAVPLHNEPTGVSQGDIDMLTGGAQMSPAADGLLPANLFRDDDAIARRTSNAATKDSPGSLSSDTFGRHADASAHRPRTPASAGSRNGSRFPSPQDSAHNLSAWATNGELGVEPDGRSINSTNASFQSSTAADVNPLATNRFASLFSNTFTRQRGRSGSNDGLQLGTLRQGESQSFPRNFADEELDPSGVRRRRGSHGLWANPMGLLNRTGAEDGLIRTRTGSGRRSRLNMFGFTSGTLQSSTIGDQPSTVRPSSINSFDQVLGRPSSESQRNPWAIAESTPNRNSPLGAAWATNGPWSRNPSRRPSVQHGSTSNLSIGSTPLEPDYQGSLAKQTTDQQPIGTRPRGGSSQSSQRPITPKLNPAAPTFKTLFSRGEAKKAAKAEKVPDRAKEKPAEPEESELPPEDPSPQNPRTSRDAQSIITSTSISESHDSLDRSTSGNQSEATTPSVPKETLMQRISRKGSSSKFNIPWSKERGGLFSRRGESTPLGTPSGELDEDAGSERHDESVINTPQATEKSSRTSLSWPNIRRKAKKNGSLTAEAAEKHSTEVGEDAE